jgi:hypothetical protein
MGKQAKIREFFSKLEAAVVKNEAIPYELLISGKALRQPSYAVNPPPTTEIMTLIPRETNFGIGLPPLSRC